MQNDVQFHGAMQGKTVLLTGAGGGIGLEAARAFAAMKKLFSVLLAAALFLHSVCPQTH